MRRFIRSLLVVFLLACALTPIAFAQEPTPPEPTDLAAVLNFLTTGGAAVVVAIFASWAAENWDGWNKLNSAIKLLIQAGVSVLLGVLAFYILTYQPTFVTQAQPVFRVIVLSAAPLIANQLWHANTKSQKQLPVGDYAFVKRE